MCYILLTSKLDTAHSFQEKLILYTVTKLWKSKKIQYIIDLLIQKILSININN